MHQRNEVEGNLAEILGMGKHLLGEARHLLLVLVLFEAFIP
jgi:hypothetical protein